MLDIRTEPLIRLGLRARGSKHHRIRVMAFAAPKVDKDIGAKLFEQRGWVEIVQMPLPVHIRTSGDEQKLIEDSVIAAPVAPLATTTKSAGDIA
jgi:hypothetical protein